MEKDSKLGSCIVYTWLNRDGDMIENGYRAPRPAMFWVLKKDGRDTRYRVVCDLNALRY